MTYIHTTVIFPCLGIYFRKSLYKTGCPHVHSQALISLYPPKMDKNVTINGTNLSSMELKSIVAAYRGTCTDILHATEVSLSVNQRMVHSV